ncbi:SDR family NAD(P)-dependent oxidoreductase [Nocardioides luti]|nr:SDR family NAD(P)-dependent oxidoreductase [Nocardioides luti]
MGKTAVVTGGASGIGLSIVRSLSAQGAKVLIADLNETGARDVASELDPTGETLTSLGVDISSREAVTYLFEACTKRLGSPDILVNSAGINIDRGIRRVSDAEWRRTLDVNLTGTFHCSQEALRLMIPRREGTIINIASRAWLGWWGQTAYSASKGGVVSMTRSLAIEVAKYGITVNCVAPGLIDTPLLRSEPTEVLERLAQSQPSGTIGRAEDVAWAASFLAGAGARQVTGQVLYVCGGKSVYARPPVTA